MSEDDAKEDIKNYATGQNPDTQGQEGDTTGNEWWNESDKHDGTIKWTTLEHSGVLFPPPYTPLPADVKMKYDGIPITLEPEAEEVACFFGEMLDATHYVENGTFRKNFFEDFKRLSRGPQAPGIYRERFYKLRL